MSTAAITSQGRIARMASPSFRIRTYRWLTRSGKISKSSPMIFRYRDRLGNDTERKDELERIVG